MSIQTNIDLQAYKKAMLSVSPEELVQFSKVMEKNISEETTKKKKKIKSRDVSLEKKKVGPSKKSDKKKSLDKKSKKIAKKVKKNKKDKKTKPTTSKKKTKHVPKPGENNKNQVDEDSLSFDSEVEEKYLDLNVELKPLKHHVKDPNKLLEEVMSIVKADKMEALVPDIAKHLSIDELKRKFADYLEGMSSARIRHVLEGQPMNSSSDTDSSDEDCVALRKDAKSSSLQANHVDSTTSNVIYPRTCSPHNSAPATSPDSRQLSHSSDEEVHTEVVEMIEETVEQQSNDGDVIVQDGDCASDSLQQHDEPQTEKRTQLEELEFQLRQRAIRSLQKANMLKKDSSQNTS